MMVLDDFSAGKSLAYQLWNQLQEVLIGFFELLTMQSVSNYSLMRFWLRRQLPI